MFKDLPARLRGVWMWIARYFSGRGCQTELQANVFVGCMIEEGSHPETGRVLSLALRERGVYPVVVARVDGGTFEVSGRSHWAPVTAVHRAGGVALAIGVCIEGLAGDLRKIIIPREQGSSCDVEGSVIHELRIHVAYYNNRGKQVGQASFTRPERYLLSDGRRHNDEGALSALIASAIQPIAVVHANFQGTVKRAVLKFPK